MERRRSHLINGRARAPRAPHWNRTPTISRMFQHLPSARSENAPYQYIYELTCGGCVSFPLTLALPLGEGTPHPAPRRLEALWIGESAASDSPSPKGEGRGEGEATLETPMRLRPCAPPPSTGAALEVIANPDSGRAGERR